MIDSRARSSPSSTPPSALSPKTTSSPPSDGIESPDAAAWPAGLPVGHCLANRSGAPARYLTVGSRYRQDVVHFPDEGLVLRIDGPARRWFHSDMTPREVADPAADKGV